MRFLHSRSDHDMIYALKVRCRLIPDFNIGIWHWQLAKRKRVRLGRLSKILNKLSNISTTTPCDRALIEYRSYWSSLHTPFTTFFRLWEVKKEEFRTMGWRLGSLEYVIHLQGHPNKYNLRFTKFKIPHNLTTIVRKYYYLQVFKNNRRAFWLSLGLFYCEWHICHISVVVQSVSRKREAVTQSNWLLVFLSLGLHNCSHQQCTMYILVAKRCHHLVVLH